MSRRERAKNQDLENELNPGKREGKIVKSLIVEK